MDLLTSHYKETHSVRAAQFLADFESNFTELLIVKPKSITLANLVNYLMK
jgi:glutamate synthase domain-containing protein 3